MLTDARRLSSPKSSSGHLEAIVGVATFHAGSSIENILAVADGDLCFAQRISHANAVKQTA